MTERPIGSAARAMLAGTVLAVLGGAFAMPGRAADAERGGELARQWCVPCHLVEDRPHEGSATDRAPPFPTIARDRSPDYLKGFLANPHFPMPNLELGRREIDDLVAYIRSLAPEK